MRRIEKETKLWLDVDVCDLCSALKRSSPEIRHSERRDKDLVARHVVSLSPQQFETKHAVSTHKRCVGCSPQTHKTNTTRTNFHSNNTQTDWCMRVLMWRHWTNWEKVELLCLFIFYPALGWVCVYDRQTGSEFKFVRFRSQTNKKSQICIELRQKIDNFCGVRKKLLNHLYTT